MAPALGVGAVAALSILATGCKNTAPGAASTSPPSATCSAPEVCVYTWPNQSCACETILPAHGSYALPLDGDDGACCFHGPRDSDPTQTHAFHNTFFAIDLASPHDGPPSKVIAARSGKVARVHVGCIDPGVSRGYADKCGNGFGNWVVLDHRDGEGSFYAHLAEVIVTEGQEVQQGQPLGTEGITGAAGERHVHFSVHRIDAPATTEGIGWPSMPYSLTYRPAQDASPVTVSVEAFPCARSNSQPIAWPPE